MNRKGISPLIATILLIAITIVVGALITAWATTYVSNQTTAVAGGGVACVYVSPSVTACNLSQSNATHLRIVVENTKSGQILQLKATVESVTGSKKTGSVVDDTGKDLTLGGMEASPAYVVNPFTTGVNLSDTSTWKSITIWVSNPDCSEMKYTITPAACS